MANEVKTKTAKSRIMAVFQPLIIGELNQRCMKCNVFSLFPFKNHALHEFRNGCKY